MKDAPGHAYAAVLSITTALLSAAYFVLVLLIAPGTGAGAIVVVPFLVGGFAYAVWSGAVDGGQGFLRTWGDPAAYLRTSMLVVFQLSLLASIYLTGPVDASLLSLIGDVAATPVIAAFLTGSTRSEALSGTFAAGVVLSLLGGTLAIVGGRSLGSVPLIGWSVVPAVPLSLALYVGLTARASRQAPAAAVVGQSMIGAGLISLVPALLLPNGLLGLGVPDVGSWGGLILIGLTAFFAAPLLYFAAIDLAGPTFPPVLMTSIPLFTLILSVIVLHLGVPLVAGLGIPIALAGAVLAVRGVGPDKSVRREIVVV